MNLQNILNEIEKVDADVYERLEHVTRRNVFQGIFQKALTGVTAAAPVAMASMLNKAYAGTDVVTEVLQFALTLEYLEAYFYNQGLSAGGLLTGTSRTIYTQIAKHENEHVKLLQTVLGANSFAQPMFDLTYQGAFPNVLSDYNTYVTVSQALEDTGVRAYKGQAPRLMDAPYVLTVALSIHSVEARHAARVRLLRGQMGWITNQDGGGAPGAVYRGDDLITQAGLNVAAISGRPADTVSQAFDEPLTKDQVLAIATPFIKKMS